MAKFIKIKVGVEKLPIAFNLDALECIDYNNNRVYTIGANESYHIHDQESWNKICAYVDSKMADNS